MDWSRKRSSPGERSQGGRTPAERRGCGRLHRDVVRVGDHESTGLVRQQVEAVPRLTQLRLSLRELGGRRRCAPFRRGRPSRDQAPKVDAVDDDAGAAGGIGDRMHHVQDATAFHVAALQQFSTDRRALHAAADRVRWTMMGRISSFGASELDGSRRSAVRRKRIYITAGPESTVEDAGRQRHQERSSGLPALNFSSRFS